MYPGACFMCGALNVCEHREIGILQAVRAAAKPIGEPLPNKPAAAEPPTKKEEPKAA